METYVDRPFGGDSFDGAVPEAEDIVAGGTVDFVCQYEDQRLNFSVDSFLGERADMAHWRPVLRNLGIEFSTQFRAFDGKLQDFSTGRLIRAVVDGNDGLLVCNAVLPNRQVLGFRLESAPDQGEPSRSARPDTRAADQAVSTLAETVRERLERGALNPGGWYTLHTAPPPGTYQGTVRVTGTVPAAARERVVEHLNPDTLNFIAQSIDGKLVFAADCLADPSLAVYYNDRVTPSTRLHLYREVAEEAAELVSQLGQKLYPAVGKRIIRVVLDVEQGSIYYYRLATGNWLVGVTLVQSSVSEADTAMGMVVRECADLLVEPAVVGGSGPRIA